MIAKDASTFSQDPEVEAQLCVDNLVERGKDDTDDDTSPATAGEGVTHPGDDNDDNDDHDHPGGPELLQSAEDEAQVGHGHVDHEVRRSAEVTGDQQCLAGGGQVGRAGRDDDLASNAKRSTAAPSPRCATSTP